MYTGRRESRQRYLDIFNTIKILASEHKCQLWLFVKTLFPDNKIMSALRKNKMILHQLDYYTIILSQITHLRSLVAQQMTRPANTQFLNILNTVSPAGLEVPPLGPKWGRWAKKLGCADCRLEDSMRTQVFSPTYPTWALGQLAKLYVLSAIYL